VGRGGRKRGVGVVVGVAKEHDKVRAGREREGTNAERTSEGNKEEPTNRIEIHHFPT
jgi:hypothetical protein